MIVRACMVFVCMTTVNCIWVCYICLWLFTGDFVYACLYDSFSEFFHFAVFVCSCRHACVCVYLLRLCMHTWVYVSIMASLLPSVCVGGWDFHQHNHFAWSGLNLRCWTQTAVKKTTQCFLPWYPQHTSDCTIMFFFFLFFLLSCIIDVAQRVKHKDRFSFAMIMAVSPWTRLIQLKALNNWANGETEALPRGKRVTS